MVNMQTLKERRKGLIYIFARKTIGNKDFEHQFKPETGRLRHNYMLRKKIKPALKQIKCKRNQYEKSSIPYITKLMSWHPPLTYVEPAQ